MTVFEYIGFACVVFGGALLMVLMAMGAFWVARLARLGYQVEEAQLSKLRDVDVASLVQAKIA